MHDKTAQQKLVNIILQNVRTSTSNTNLECNTENYVNMLQIQWKSNKCKSTCNRLSWAD